MPLTLSSSEQYYLRAISGTNVIVGVVFLPLAVYFAYSLLTTPGPYLPDFIPYYTAAHFARLAPLNLYTPSAYTDFYRALKTGLPTHMGYFGFLGSPTLAMFLEPLSYLNHIDAFLAWSAINILLSFWLAHQMGMLATRENLHDWKFFFQSCVFGVFATFQVFMKGQFTLLLCVCFTYFLLSIQQKKLQNSGIWLAVLLQIQPQIFLPLLFYMAGCRQWRMLTEAMLFSLLCVALSTGFIYTHVWPDYIHMLYQYMHRTMTVDAQYQTSSMNNLTSLLSTAFGYGTPVKMFSSAIQALLCGFCFLWPWRADKRPDINSVTLLAPLCFFISPYFREYNTLLLLPISVITTMLLQRLGQARWMILCYILGSYVAAVNYQWNCRILLLVMCGISVYLMILSSKWRGDETPTGVTTS